MEKEREEICRKCSRLPSIHHPDYPVCKQPIYPINDKERQLTGIGPDTPVTRETLLKMAEISLMPYCRERMKADGYFDRVLKYFTCDKCY